MNDPCVFVTSREAVVMYLRPEIVDALLRVAKEIGKLTESEEREEKTVAWRILKQQNEALLEALHHALAVLRADLSTTTAVKAAKILTDLLER